jgi:hypothetical protein
MRKRREPNDVLTEEQAERVRVRQERVEKRLGRPLETLEVFRVATRALREKKHGTDDITTVRKI